MGIKPRYWVPALLVALPLLVFLLWKGKPREVDVATAHYGPAVELVYATGYVEARQPVTVAARVTAPVAQVLVDEGQRVRRGQTLLLLENDEQQGLLAQAEAERARAGLQERRIVALSARGWVTRAARDQAVATANSARGAVTSAQARLAQYRVTAGIDGLVLKRDVEPGDLATPGKALIELGDPARTRITATVDERDLPRVHVGQAALLRADAWPGRAIKAHVSEITPAGDPRERAFRVRLGIDEAAALPIGLTVEVNVVTRRIDRALLVPAAAITADRIWVIDGKRVRARAVKTGIVGDQAQVLSGVRDGDIVIVNPPSDMKDNERVRARKASKT